MKTSTIIEVYKALKEAKLTKMESKEKFQVIKIMREIKPTAEEWDSFISTVDEKLKGENHDEMAEKIKQWQKEGENTTLTLDERKEVNEYIAKYNAERNELVNAEMEKEVEVKYERISQEAFERLVDSNDLSVGVMEMLYGELC